MTHITPDELAHTLDRSIELHEAVLELTESFEPYPELHFDLAFQSALLSMEHATASLLLLQNEMEAPGMALLRPQFESLVRAIWLVYAASEAQVEKLAMPLTIETARRGDDLPMLSEMLKRLEATSEAPRHIVAQLQAYKDITWKALNSFAHGGMHPLSKYVTGYPPKLVFDTLCNSNGIFMMAAQLLCILTGAPENQTQWRKLIDEFTDCFHPINWPAKPV
ncbi:hypothetical protein [Hydrogenophaga sp.]|uniref:DUF6988 family protein n=1 Tax=Hydrogenophaga sp. TaxID=1904254 RepID=UPI0027362BD2|nr:hypothetical protein [Hydrogenophaga sp.]MDP3108681.1 hypothetical protein [Hydrogenophaga sp.]